MGEVNYIYKQSLEAYSNKKLSHNNNLVGNSVKEKIVSIKEKSMEKTIDYYVNDTYCKLSLETVDNLFMDLEKQLKLRIEEVNIGYDKNDMFGYKTYIEKKSQINIKVVKKMIEEKEERKKALINKLNINRVQFLKSSMAEYMRDTIKNYDSYSDIIMKLSSLEKPLSYDVDNGREEN